MTSDSSSQRHLRHSDLLREIACRVATLTREMDWLENPSPRAMNLMATCSPERVSTASCTKPEDPLKQRQSAGETLHIEAGGHSRQWG